MAEDTKSKVENNAQNTAQNSNLATIADALFEYVRDIIYNTANATLDIDSLPTEFHNLGKGLNYLQSVVGETKIFAKELAKGNLNCESPARGNEIAAPLKTLHASLKHLTWQSQQVAIGDYKQRVNFMGEFSDAFNNMIDQLQQQRKIIMDERTILKQYVEMILESTTNPLLVFDKDEKLVYISNSWFHYCDIFGEKEVFGKQVDELFEPIVSDENLMDIKYSYMSANSGRKVIVIELDTNFNLQQSIGHFKVQFTPMIDEEGIVGGMMLFLFDLTESEQARRTAEHARELAEQSLRVKTTFLAKMSHEMRTPMNAILGITQIELQKKNLIDESKEAFEKIFDSSNNLLILINDILDLSKIETGKIELNLNEYDIPSFLQDTIQLNIMQIGQKKIDFFLEIDETFPLILYGDQLRLKQVLNNLLSNAIKYTEKGFIKLSISTICPSHVACGEGTTDIAPPVSLRAGGEGGGENSELRIPNSEVYMDEEDEEIIDPNSIYVSFAVEDSGQGIKEEDQKTLFSEYSRFNTKENRDAEGAGLGLNIAKRLVEIMDGYIKVQSIFGKGSTFTAVVKQQKIDDQCIGKTIAENLRNNTYKCEKHFEKLQFVQSKMPYGKVLIVDDVETNLYVASKLMQPYLLKIDTVLSGFEAIENISNGKVYDIIFMDHMMPKMDGIETTQKLRAMDYDGIIVALTANALAGNDVMFKQNGFDDFISKPIDTRLLDDVLNKYILEKYPEEAAKYVDAADIIETAETSISIQTEDSSISMDPKLLQIFCRDVKLAADTITSSLKDGDIKLFTTNAHAMKSLLATIAENKKSRLAADLEQAGLKDDKVFIYANAHDFVEYLYALHAKLSLSISDSTDDNDDIEEDISLLDEQLKLIIGACQNYDDSSTYDILNKLNEFQWKSDTKTALENIHDLLYLHSDFESAEEKATELLKLKMDNG